MSPLDYAAFLSDKRRLAKPVGSRVADADISPVLFPFQRALVKWAVRKGRAALFADTGLGKTLMQLEWARLTGERTLVVAPLSVAQQTVEESGKLGIRARYLRADDGERGIVATNYEMLPHFDPSKFGAVVLDESSILKSFEGKTRTRLIEMFRDVPFRLCCTATPAPNDIQEMANHAEFLGVMSRVEMLAEFFVHDDQGWRLKRHGARPFYRWLASWAMTLKRPSDLGFEDEGFDLPALDVSTAIVQSEYVPDGQLFHAGLRGIGDRSKVRRATAEVRIAAAMEMMRGPEQWIAWVGLND